MLTCLYIAVKCVGPLGWIGVTIAFFPTMKIASVSKVLVRRLTSESAMIKAGIFSSHDYEIRNVEEKDKNLRCRMKVNKLEKWREKIAEETSWFPIISCQSAISSHPHRGLETLGNLVWVICEKTIWAVSAASTSVSSSSVTWKCRPIVVQFQGEFICMLP